jgi:molybdopterin-containing oxidoreductase family iron-sulfur binding subunit
LNDPTDVSPPFPESRAPQGASSADVDLDAPFSPAPAADDPRRGKEVLAPVGNTFEAPAKTFVPGPLYVGVEERLPELAEPPMAKGEAAPGQWNFDRRSFMEMFSATSVLGAAACVQRPVEKAIPYVQQPLDQFPGEPVYYATTCGECASGCGVMVKTREGRPVKLEGLPAHPISDGHLCAVGQSALQGMWHPERRRAPAIRSGDKLTDAKWDEVLAQLGDKLGKLTKIGVFTGGSTGSRHGFLREWLEKMGSTSQRLYTYESNTLYEAIPAAHKIAYGVLAMPRADLHQAKLIVGVGADFLDIGTSTVYNTKAYTESHAFKAGTKGRHVQFESLFTMTGARADERTVIPPGTETLVTLLLVRSLYENKGAKGSSAARAQIQQVLEQKADLLSGGYERVGVTRDAFDKLAAEMLQEPSVLMAGGLAFDENATNLQLAAIMANELVGAYDTILQLQKGWMTPPVVPGDLARFLAEAGDLEALIVIDADPLFALPPSFGVKDLIAKIPTVISVQDYPNDVDRVAHYVLNAHHYLESWGDEQPVAGLWSLRQATVRPTMNSMQAEDILMWIAAHAKKPFGYQDYRAYIRKKWAPIQQMVGSTLDFDTFFDAALHQGFVVKLASQVIPGFAADTAAAFKYVDTGKGGLRLAAPLDFRLHDGRHAHKPILQEAADALTTITWDTWVALNPTTASKLGFKKMEVVKVAGPSGTFEAAVYPLPGLHPDMVVVPRGNGHDPEAGAIHGGNGVNPLVALGKATDAATGSVVTYGAAVTLTKTGAVFHMAQLQKHNDIANRKDIVKTVGLAEAAASVGKTKDVDDQPDIFPALPKKEHRWGMSIDLSRCTGCNACYVACSTENNVSQVGRQEILLGREMHWIKIDRYFSGSTDNPEVTFQPMLCQHCMHAPCEAVCPVYATTHDPEGINAMTYNRCIGTRYCANACPYKIRRFNWFTYRWGELGRHDVVGQYVYDRNPRAMNPDVTVRTRGVMEKCTFCYQRVRDAKHRAMIAGTQVQDADLKTACQQTCPADAITFGNLNNPGAAAAALRKDFRAYLALNGTPEEHEYNLKTLPNVSYLAKVTFAAPASEHGGGEHGGAGEPAGGEHG